MTTRLILVVVAFALWASPALAVRFNHAVHWQEYTQSETCSTCHKMDAETIVPDRKVCEQCHDDKEFIAKVEFSGLQTHGPAWTLNHGPLARKATLRSGGAQQFNCASCHEQKMCLQCHRGADNGADEMGKLGNAMVNVHLADFAVTHPIAARTQPQLCTTCHENKFCVDCHNEFAPADLAILSHRRSWSDLAVSPSGPAHSTFNDSPCQSCHPNSVLPSHEWSGSHAREARKNLATCQACHPDGDVCLRCHSATSGLGINPHPKNWDKISGRLERASGGRTCARCH